ncbi:hypothetical protein N7474_002370 [Penicillium riverlandense]|uniref:uncharacterized protein n=1 Tax=Penicillium riverlandense TaxID=1903569 RepID=UPI002546BA1E|nr:uncharacterized protein N7474_002370 [Penicillium riverlandense]KAJ5825232.1 hypothetical protein N7474_002370 [Penicillium riverlandense]
MHKAIIAGAALIAFSMIPTCPAPIGLIVTGLAAPLIGGLTYIGINSETTPYGYSGKRDLKFPRAFGYPGVSQDAYNQCKSSTKGINVHVQQTAENSFKIIGVSPECMNLATFFTSNKGAPYPCSNNCLQYNNLTAADTKKLKDTVQSLLK